MRTPFIALLLFVAAPALAQPADPQAVISALDRNTDGKVDLAEFLAAEQAIAARADTDGRPGLSLDDFRASLDAGARATAEASFSAFDQNASGALEPAEVAAYHTYVFNNVLDLDHDGGWTVAEYRTFLASRQAAASPSAAAADTGPEAAIAALDTDHNGQVSAFEYMSFQGGRFTQFDANVNGRLTIGEFRASLDARGRSRADASLRAFDANRNNQLSQDEFLAYHAYVFSNVLDTNHDGSWTADEYRSLLAQTR